MNKIYHVAKNGSDNNTGNLENPFLTIQKAADVAVAGDRVIVHEGEYREWVKPRNGGLSEDQRIVYEAAEGEHVVIKGSERITGWEQEDNGNVYKVTLPNSMFGAYNPYAVEIFGDWLIEPAKRVHTGEVYLNGKSFYESPCLDDVRNPQKRYESLYQLWDGKGEKIQDPDDTIYQWYAVVEDKTTTIWANFQGIDPNKELVEINVRRSCFYPEVTGFNYITVRGFEMAQAATPWTPPTADQPGLLGPNWSKGWIIEENCIHDSKCSGVSLGKEASTGNNEFSKWHRKPGYQYQMETVFKARNIGWSKERIGSHIVRNNCIYDCGQNAVVGHLGAVFSEIYGNEIYNIAVKHEFFGHEIAGIKLHAAIDVRIHNNYIHNCALGTWLDWQAQGVRVSSNVYGKNNRDFFVEVSHGPYLVDNNILVSPECIDNAAQGGAYVHNICGGFIIHYPVLNRATPYHLPHSTEVAGTALVYGSDDRFYQNIFVGGKEENRVYGTNEYNGASVSMDEYIEQFLALGNRDVEQYEQIKQPAYIDGNVYLKGAAAFDREEHNYLTDFDPDISIIDEGDKVYLEFTLPEEMFNKESKIVETKDLGMPRIVEARFENPDGSDIVFDRDMLGNVRTEHPKAGALEEVKAGKNRILVWTREGKFYK